MNKQKFLVLSTMTCLSIAALWSCSRDFSPITSNNNSPPKGNNSIVKKGEPIEIIATGRSPDWSPDGKKIAYIGFENDGNNIFITTDTGGVSQQLTHLSSSLIWTPSWSPDGKYVAFSAIMHGGPGGAKILTVPSAGGNIEQITPDSLTVQGCDWSPNGKQIVFDSASPHYDAVSLWIINLAYNHLIRFATKRLYEGWPKYSPDGTRIAFESLSVIGGDNHVWTVAPDGSDARQITKNEGQYPSWSPDGKWISFSSYRSGNFDIWIIPSEGGTEIQITNSLTNENRPVWSPDGKKIAYDSSIYPGTPSIWVIPISVPY